MPCPPFKVVYERCEIRRQLTRVLVDSLSLFPFLSISSFPTKSHSDIQKILLFAVSFFCRFPKMNAKICFFPISFPAANGFSVQLYPESAHINCQVFCEKLRAILRLWTCHQNLSKNEQKNNKLYIINVEH